MKVQRIQGLCRIFSLVPGVWMIYMQVGRGQSTSGLALYHEFIEGIRSEILGEMGYSNVCHSNVIHRCGPFTKGRTAWHFRSELRVTKLM